jgi:alpha-glucosidase
MLCFYRTALGLRHQEPAFTTAAVEFPVVPAGVLGFRRGTDRPVSCWVNLGSGPVPLPTGVRLLLASQDATGGLLAPDAAAWFVS